MSEDSYYVVNVSLPQLLFEGRLSRQALIEDWSERLEAQRKILGFLGIHEGSALAQELTLDAGESPADRDLVADLEWTQAQFYFENRFGAETWREEITDELGEEFPISLSEQPAQDWNAKWKENFRGIEIAPFWQILPSWQKDKKTDFKAEHKILINPGLGFGTGTHPTTQLCLRILGRQKSLKSKKFLDFGAGSGILSVGAAKLGAQVDAVEIDELAVESAIACAKLNQVEDQIKFSRSLWEGTKQYDFIAANILRNVLMDYCEELVLSLKRDGLLYLSGILELDLYDVIPKYLLELSRVHQRSEEPEIHQNGSWYGLLFRPN